jgi:hypothetical protein
MMWGCISWEGVGYATRIKGRMDAGLYVGILEDKLQQSIKYFKKRCQDVIFQQDNDPKHTSKRAKTWFQDHRIKVIDWPAQSPDLNPIEHLWQQLKQKLTSYEHPPQIGLAQFSSELWSKPEPSRTRLKFSLGFGAGAKPDLWSSSRFRVGLNLAEPFRTGSKPRTKCQHNALLDASKTLLLLSPGVHNVQPYSMEHCHCASHVV